MSYRIYNMDLFVRSVKKKYKERLITRENQWPHRHGNKLVKLQLVENETSEQRGRRIIDSTRKTEIKCADFFLQLNKTLATVIRKVLVEGDAGIGKTTLCTSASIDWADGGIFQQFELVLLLPLRDKRVTSAETIPELLKLLHGSQAIRTTVASSLEETEGENVLIIADGWDELSKDKRKKDSFLYDLLFGSLLPFVSVLLTSRPSASGSLCHSSHIDRVVRVAGFSKENINEYIKSEFAEDEEKCSYLLEQLESSPVIESICSIPLNCAIVCELSHTHGVLPSTMTELYTNIILHTIFRNITKLPEYSSIMNISSFNNLPGCLQEKFWSLCQFAYESIEKNQVVFTQEQICAMHLDMVLVDELLCFGLVQYIQSVLSDEVGYGHSFHFLHLTIQEFLAAYHLARQSPDKQLEVVKSHADSPFFRMVWRFFFGISCTKSLHKHSKLRVELSQEVLTSFLWKVHFSDRLLLFHCSLESGKNSEIVTLVAKHQLLRYSRKAGFFIRRNFARNAFDCAAILHVISNTESCDQIIINFSGCRLGDQGIQPLVNTLALKSSKVKVRCLYLSGNNLSAVGVSNLFRRTAASFTLLRDLRLSQNPLEAVGIKELEKSIHAGIFSNLSVLNLAESLSTDADKNASSLASFLDAISAQCHYLCILDLSKNNLGAAGAKCVGKALSQLTGYKKFYTECIREDFDLDYCTRSELDLSETMLGDEGVCAFSQNIQDTCYIGRFDISGNNIHSIGVSSLAESISSDMLNLEDLCLNDNPLGLDGVVAIGRLLTSKCQLKDLYLSNCQLTATSKDYPNTSCSDINTMSRSDPTTSSSSYCPSSAIHTVREKLFQMPQSCNDKLWTVCVDKNNFSGENGEVLAGLMYVCRNVHFLHSTQCSITLQSFQSLFCQLKLHTTLPNLYCWYLGKNNISDEAIDVLIQHIPLLSKVNSIYLCQNLDESSNLKQEITTQKSTRRSIGSRVVRGRDWQSGDEDGGEGHVGTVVEIDEPRNCERRVVVQWDCGNRGSYSCGGGDGKYELRVAYNPDCSHSVVCTSCRTKKHLVGWRWKYLHCKKRDLCTSCYMKITTSSGVVTKGCSLQHEFECYTNLYKYDFTRHNVQIPPRAGARRIEAKGMFKGAQVTRVLDLDPDQQKTDFSDDYGEVISLQHIDSYHVDKFGNRDKESFLTAEVKWASTKKKTTHRLGFEGKVDIKCVTAASGGYYYPDHLPMLGARKGIQQEYLDMIRRTQQVDEETSGDDQKDEVHHSDYCNDEETVGDDWDKIHHGDNKAEIGEQGGDNQDKIHGKLLSRDPDEQSNEFIKSGVDDGNHESGGSDNIDDTKDSSSHHTSSPVSMEQLSAQLETQCIPSMTKSDLPLPQMKIEPQNSDILSIDDLKKVRTAIWEARVKWYDLGVELTISVFSLDEIKAANFHQPADCFTAMLRQWLQRVDLKPTWTSLVEALKSPPVNHPQLAEKIEKECC